MQNLEQQVFSRKHNNINVQQDEPQLRFPGFKDKWKQTKICDVLEFISTNSYSRDKLNSFDGTIKNIHYGDIHTIFPTLLDFDNENIPYINVNINISKIKEDSYCKTGDLIIADASEDYEDIGKSIELINVHGNIVSGLHTILAREKNKTFAIGFKGYLFSNPHLKKEIKRIANGVSVLGISKKNLEKINLNFPSIAEQEKITRFLSLIDAKISLLEKTYLLYFSIKKSFLRNFLSNTFKFSNFDNKWDKVMFKEFLKEYSEKSTENNQFPLLSSTKEKIYLQSEYFNRNVASKDNTGYKILYKNQLVLSPQNLWMGNINVNKEYEIGIVSPSYKIYDIDTSIIYPEYFSYIIKTPCMLYEYNNVSEQGASIVRKNLNKKLFEKIEILIPSLEEQKKIMEILLLFDKKLSLIEKKKKEIINFKKEMLNILFI